jgi:3-deoxy-7-phosphoheptulonate synthase
MIVLLKPEATEVEISQISSMLETRSGISRIVKGAAQPVILVECSDSRHELLEVFRTQPFIEDIVRTDKSGKETGVTGILFRTNADRKAVESTLKLLEKMNLTPQLIEKHGTIIIGHGNERTREQLLTLPFVDRAMMSAKRYKLASREFSKADTVVNLRGNPIGGKHFQMIAGPCAVESLSQMRRVAKAVTDCGVKIIRGGAFKPRTSPYDFQGLGEKGLEILAQIREEFNVAIVTEVVNEQHIERIAKAADCLQIGSRNSQNFQLLEAAASAGLPVILKRGMASTIEEWLSAAEYLLVNGCRDVILCERGIKTFEPATRNTLDLGAVALAKQETHLPVVVDPSHAGGRLDLVLPLGRAGIAAGADGLLVEVHPEPSKALSDAAQQIPAKDFELFYSKLKPIIKAMGKVD